MQRRAPARSKKARAKPRRKLRALLPSRQHLPWFLVVLSLPFYVFGSGRPQPADFMMLFMLGTEALRAGGVSPQITAPIRSLLRFVIYVTLINVAWAVMTSNPEFLKSTAFYGFNFVIFSGFVIRASRRDEEFLRWTLNGAALSVISLAFLAIPFGHRMESGRLELFFNNPNQLAYYVITMLSIVVALAPRFKPSALFIGAASLAGAFLELRTGSRAGLLGIVVLLGIYFGKRPILLAAMSAPGFFYLLYSDLLSENALWRHRIAVVEESGTEQYLADRGIDRLFDHPEHLFVGAGEGFHERFHFYGQELHSSAANLIFSYGTLGTLLFAVFAWGIIKTGGRRIALLMIPSFAYGLFHNGLRFRPFWLMLGVFAVWTVVARRPKKSATVESAAKANDETGSKSDVESKVESEAPLAAVMSFPSGSDRPARTPEPRDVLQGAASALTSDDPAEWARGMSRAFDDAFAAARAEREEDVPASLLIGAQLATAVVTTKCTPQDTAAPLGSRRHEIQPDPHVPFTTSEWSRALFAATAVMDAASATRLAQHDPYNLTQDSDSRELALAKTFASLFLMRAPSPMKRQQLKPTGLAHRALLDVLDGDTAALVSAANTFADARTSGPFSLPLAAVAAIAESRGLSLPWSDVRFTRAVPSSLQRPSPVVPACTSCARALSRFDTSCVFCGANETRELNFEDAFFRPSPSDSR